MKETVANFSNENVIDISVHTNKRTILINGLKNVMIRPEHKQCLYPLRQLEELIISGECNDDINNHIQCVNYN